MDSRTNDIPMSMTRYSRYAWPLLLIGLLSALSTGCAHMDRARMAYESPSLPRLGTTVDPFFAAQELGGEASDFVIYQHEFDLNTYRLNTAGEDHIRQIVARTNAGQDFQIVIERSFTSPREETEYEYAVHPNPQLDERRRAVVVRTLEMFGIADAEQRVVVAPPFAEGYEAPEAASAYNRSFYGNFSGYGGFGNFGSFGGFNNFGSFGRFR